VIKRRPVLRRPVLGRRGVSLVETLVAVVLLVAVLVPVLSLMHTSTAQLVQSRDHLIAEQLARTLIETYPLAPGRFGSALEGDAAECDDLLKFDQARRALTGGRADVDALLLASAFTMKVTVARGEGGHAGLGRVEAVIAWSEGPRRIARTFARLVLL
jgi:Tfp pilus assembly protein PilV